MLTIKCSKCKAKLFKYQKIGKGRVLRCWKDRIHKDFTKPTSNCKIQCDCGNIIGTDEGTHIKMKQNSFIFSGTKE